MTYKEGIPTLQVIVAIQQQLAIQFPFFAITNPPQQNLWASVMQPPPSSQIQVVPQKQSQIQNKPNQSQLNPYNQSTLAVSQLNKSQVQQPKQQEQKESTSVADLTTSVISTIKDIWKQGATLLETQQEKEKRYTAELTEKSLTYRQQITQNIQNSLNELRIQSENLEDLYIRQARYKAELHQEEQKVYYSINESDDLSKQIDQQIVLLTAKPDLSTLDNMDQLSKQLLNLFADLHSYRDGLLYLFNEFRDGELSYEILQKNTRLLAQLSFDGTILIRKCRGVL